MLTWAAVVLLPAVPVQPVQKQRCCGYRSYLPYIAKRLSSLSAPHCAAALDPVLLPTMQVAHFAVSRDATLVSSGLYDERGVTLRPQRQATGPPPGGASEHGPAASASASASGLTWATAVGGDGDGDAAAAAATVQQLQAAAAEGRVPATPRSMVVILPKASCWQPGFLNLGFAATGRFPLTALYWWLDKDSITA